MVFFFLKSKISNLKSPQAQRSGCKFLKSQIPSGTKERVQLAATSFSCSLSPFPYSLPPVPCSPRKAHNMITTVTLNPTIDKSLVVPRFEVGKTNRGEVRRTDAGGKGINVAKAVKEFGAEVCALGFVAGSNGQFILEALAASGIPADFINVPGETRVNLKIHDPVCATETELNEPGFQVLPEHLEAMKQKIREYGSRCDVMVFSGSLPPGAPPETYAELISIAGVLGARCMLDTGGSALRCGLEARPLLTKPNRAEVEGLLQERLNTRSELAEAARKLLEMGAEEAVISLGADGAIAATRKDLLSARPPAVAPRSSVGAGDAMVAALAFGEVKHLPFRESFRLAMAASAAAVTMEGSKVADLALIQSLIPLVQVEDVG
jgi:1-phosphofructokinase